MKLISIISYWVLSRFFAGLFLLLVFGLFFAFLIVTEFLLRWAFSNPIFGAIILCILLGHFCLVGNSSSDGRIEITA